MKKLSERYSVIIVPRRSSGIRRFSLSRRALLGGSALTVLFFFGFAFVVGRMVAYRKAYLATEKVRHEAHDFQLERAELASQLLELETQYLRTSRYVAHLAAVGKKTERVISGQGPISRDPSPEQMGDERFWRGDVVLGRQAISKKIEELLQKSTALEERVHELFLHDPVDAFQWSALPTIWPAEGHITSIFGDRRRFEGIGRWHEGIDIATSYGSPIIASGEGIVTYVGYRGGYGKTIIVDHGRGLTTLFGHCSEIYVREGMKVSRGTALGKVGNTGFSTGPHLHYEVRVDGIPLDPTKYIIEKT